MKGCEVFFDIHAGSKDIKCKKKNSVASKYRFERIVEQEFQ